MKHLRSSLSVLTAGILFAICESTAQAQLYHLTDLGVVPGQTISKPAAINNQGQVTGGSGSFAFLYAGGTMQNLGTLPGGNTSAGRSINNLGQVVGSSQYANGGAIGHATLWSNGTATDLGTLRLAGNYSAAAGINASTQVVGSSGPSGSSSNTRAFIWDATNGMQDIGTLGGQYARAAAINDSGFVTGSSQIPTGFGSSHAFVWDAATGMHDLGTIAGDSSSGTSINNNGHIAGGSTINDFDNRGHAFFYDGVMHDLGSLGGSDFYSDRSSASGINIHDEIVGSTFRPYEGGALYQIAFVYRNGVMSDLETLVDASGTDYRLYSANAINDSGQIVVDAVKISTNEIHAVLLTPCPDCAPVLKLSSAVSRKTHGAAGSFDVNLPLNGEAGVECRSGVSGHTLVFTFTNDVTSGNASVTAGIGSVSGVPIFNGRTMTVNLTSVTDAQKITVTLSNVTDAFSQILPNTNVSMNVLWGDTNGNKIVNSSDITEAKMQSGSPVNGTNFRADVTLNGTINSSDAVSVRLHSGGGIP